MISCMNMGAIAAAVKTATVETDPYWSSVSCLLHGDTLIDSSSNSLAITNSGVTISTTTKKYGTGSLYFNGSSYINITDNAKVELDTKLFTIECWVCTQMTTNIVLFSKWGPSSGYLMVLTATDFVLYLGSYTPISITHSGFPSNTWFHIALSRDSSSYVNLFINGVLQGRGSYANTNAGNTKPLTLGCNNDGYGSKMTGYIDDFRFTKGVCRYTSNFTPPSSQFPDS